MCEIIILSEFKKHILSELKNLELTKLFIVDGRNSFSLNVLKFFVKVKNILIVNDYVNWYSTDIKNKIINYINSNGKNSFYVISVYDINLNEYFNDYLSLNINLYEININNYKELKFKKANKISNFFFKI